MARYTGPKTKIARKFGEPIFGPDKVLSKRTILRDSTEIHADVKRRNMEFSCVKNSVQNTRMECWKNNSV